MQNSKYVVNLIDLQNIYTSATGESSAQQIQEMVQYATKTTATDFLCNFTTGAGINVLSDMTTGTLTVAGTLTASNFISSNSNLYVSGDLGVSAVYDTLYNPPISLSGSIYTLAPVVAGSNDSATFTVARSGPYQIQTLLRVGGSAPTIETTGYLRGYLYDTTNSSNVAFGEQTISGSGLVGPDPSTGTIDYVYQTNVSLLSNSTYRYTFLSRNGAGGAGTWSLGTGSQLAVRVWALC